MATCAPNILGLAARLADPAFGLFSNIHLGHSLDQFFSAIRRSGEKMFPIRFSNSYRGT
jgi:hypothetical protein